MRVSINAADVEGPSGGGNQFAAALKRHLAARGHDVLPRLTPAAEAVFLVSAIHDPRTTTFSLDEVEAHRRAFPNTPVALRVNDSDEGRGVDLGRNAAILRAAAMADHTVFVSAFVRDLHIGHGLDATRPQTVIHNAADRTVFHPKGGAEWRPGEKMRIVTHHWSPNFMKGFDIYERLDQMLDSSPWRDEFEFTVIGNAPLGVGFRNTRRLPPLWGAELARAIKENHLYVTAARNEAGGNHYVEAMACGLPVLHLDTGSLPEYCGPYGVRFTLADFEQRLLEARERYAELRQAVKGYTYGAEEMAAEYERVLESVVAERRAHPRPPAGLGARVGYGLKPLRRALGRARRAVGRWIAG